MIVTVDVIDDEIFFASVYGELNSLIPNFSSLYSEGGSFVQVPNVLANRIDAAGVMISYDDACKQVLANKYILAWILKSCIREYMGEDIHAIAEKYIEGDAFVSTEPVHLDETAGFVKGMRNESTSIREGKTTFDIKFRTILPETREGADMVINVEAQNDFYPGYRIEKRGVYYTCRMISEQYGTVFEESEYQKIKKVASIWICTNPPKYLYNTIARYSLEKNDLVGEIKDNKKNYDLITVVMVCLGGKERYTGLLKMLDVLFSQQMEAAEKKSILQDEFGIPMTRNLEGGLEKVCNLSKGVYNSGYDNGFKKAVDTTTVQYIVLLMKNKNMDIEECLDTFHIPETKRDEYRKSVMTELGLTTC